MSTDDFGNDAPHSSPDNLLHDFTPQGDWARAHNTTHAHRRAVSAAGPAVDLMERAGLHRA